MSQPKPSAGALFDAALQLPLADRDAFLRGACVGDEPLRERVATLLQAHEEAGSFTAGPVAPPPATMHQGGEAEGV